MRNAQFYVSGKRPIAHFKDRVNHNGTPVTGITQPSVVMFSFLILKWLYDLNLYYIRI